MRVSIALLSLLLLFSGEFIQSLAVRRTHAVRIPEHTCHKLLATGTCELQKCSEECSKDLSGFGECKDNMCFCTYYCKQPPV